jgi:hypothetical protein
MIRGAHVLISSGQPDELRAFFRDTLQFPSVGEGEWPVFKLPPAELGVHDTEIAENEGRAQFYLICDDLEGTIEELRGRGVEFDGEPTDAGFAMQALINLPTGAQLAIYEPRYQTAI